MQKDKLSSILLEKVSNPKEMIKDIKDFTVEDVVVIYAYAEAIVETVREPLVILDKNLHIMTANKSFFDTFKVTKKNTYKKLIFEIGNGQWDIPLLKKQLQEILPKNSHFEDFEVTHKFTDIGVKTMMLNARRIVLEGHKTELILLAIEDITLKSIIDKHKDDFIGIATHELKTPLTNIKVFIQIIHKYHSKSQDDESKFLIEKALTQIDRMENMIKSFTSVYNLQTGKLKLNKEVFNLSNSLKEIQSTLQQTTKTHKIITNGKPLGEIYADKEKISQVITNLITNAIKYSPDGNKVIISTDKDKKKITISVEDFGKGIPIEFQNVIFERFFRVKGDEKEKIPGLGLGLYISKEIITEHKGTMGVESNVGKGSKFYFTLPVRNSKKK